MNKIIYLTLITLVPCLGMAAIYSENFESLTAGPLDGQDSWGGENLGDPAAGSISAGSIGGFGGTQVLDLGGAWNGRDVTLPNATVYYGFSVTIANRTGGTVNETFFRFGGWDTFVKLDAVNDAIESRIGNTSTVQGAAGLTEGDSYRVVGELNWNGTAFDSHKIYLNPTGLIGSNTAVVTHNNPTTLAGATRIQVRNDDTASLMDNIVITTSWAEAVPEPGTLGLLGLGVGLLMWARRRQD